MDSASTTAQRRGRLLRKSRSGCRDCRLRKVKCDEIKPVCSNCRRRYVSIHCCDWTTDAPYNGGYSYRSDAMHRLTEESRSPEDMAVQEALKYTKNAPTHSLTMHPRSEANTSQWRTLELRLMYHYTAVVSHTMPDCNGASTRAWERTIPQLSFDSEVVLNPMMALSALHLHAHSPNDSAMAVALRRYLDRTLVNHRQALSNPGGSLSEQLWLSAVLITHVYWLLAHQTQLNEAYELPISTMKMLEGVSILFARNNVFLGKLGYGPFEHEALPQIAPGGELPMAAEVQLHGIEEDLTYLLDAFDIVAMPEDVKSIYVGAKDYVLYHYRAFYSGTATKTLRRFIVTMAVRCHPRYRGMLEKHDPLAMALLARMLVLLRGLDFAWWVSGKGEYEVVERDVRGIRELMPANFRWAIDWPCRVLDGDIVLNRD
ncbi:hypothetical protein BKA56DRAFT_645405 [Ilyonectria sp. MPI-CAGE-AT-0026]|nr:hypothetical protein BKA56DRAFT_645405 [Ilyonectria sp. MPI-CAGE-AT-0026]